jgi:hypothetical protein
MNARTGPGPEDSAWMTGPCVLRADGPGRERTGSLRKLAGRRGTIVPGREPGPHALKAVSQHRRGIDSGRSFCIG